VIPGNVEGAPRTPSLDSAPVDGAIDSTLASLERSGLIVSVDGLYEKSEGADMLINGLQMIFLKVGIG
jgi:hypothetical protein